MIPVQYRDPQTEEILERRYEEGAPAIGTRVRIGFDEYGSSTGGVVPTSCIVYVHRVGREVRRRPGLRPERAFGSERSGARLARVASPRSCREEPEVMTDRTRTYAEGIELTAEVPDEFVEIPRPRRSLSWRSSREYRGRVEELLARRAERQRRISAGEMPDFLPETREIRRATGR